MPAPQTILVTGGTGYIGSHMVVELMAAGHDVAIIDNLCNSKASMLDRIQRIVDRRPWFEQMKIKKRRGPRKTFDRKQYAGIHLRSQSI
jgi:UDP-glucose 4-epimerase